MDGLGMSDLTLISADVLAQLMPMSLTVSASGVIRHAGPTLTKLVDGKPLSGRRFFDLFDVQKPRTIFRVADFAALYGQKLQVVVRGEVETPLRGLAVPLIDERTCLLNFSFGIAVADAVRDHRLTRADFAPTDLTVELLYLNEAKAAVMSELAALNGRLQAARAASETQAHTDPLTGLANRRALNSELLRDCQLIGRGGVPFALMHLDLDFFKAVNDSMGHAAGDRVLAAVADVLRRETRKTDTVARVGGDEFVLILRGEADGDRVAQIAERIIAGLEHPIIHHGWPCRISGSIGITVSASYDEPTVDVMHADADKALYAAKRAGRRRWEVWRADLLPEQDCGRHLRR